MIIQSTLKSEKVGLRLWWIIEFGELEIFIYILFLLLLFYKLAILH